MIKFSEIIGLLLIRDCKLFLLYFLVICRGHQDLIRIISMLYANLYHIFDYLRESRLFTLNRAKVFYIFDNFFP